MERDGLRHKHLTLVTTSPFWDEIICSELNQLRDILLALPNAARRAGHCHTEMSLRACQVLQDQQLPQLHHRDSWARGTGSLLTDVPSLGSPQKCLEHRLFLSSFQT